MNDELVVVVGLGYVGLPLAVEFGSVRKTIGLDLSSSRVAQCKDKNLPDSDVSDDAWSRAVYLQFTTEWSVIAEADYVIVAVPTPVDSANIPDFTALISASEQIGARMKAGAVVVYESTVYPGATEEICVPVLEACSGLVWKEDFFVGYSPERINPGDPNNKLENIVKITSGSTENIANIVDMLYQRIIHVGTFKAASIKVAEASKVIENTQRDVNIALINEFSRIFHALGINTDDVLQAAQTKWNFQKFVPGFVGGHCISVDPYYLIHRSEKAGYTPSLIKSARLVNEAIPKMVAVDLVNKLKKVPANNTVDCLVVGATFKANCPDFRNTKTPVLIGELKNSGLLVDLYDPFVDLDEWLQEFDHPLIDHIGDKKYRAIVICNEHNFVKELGVKYWKNLLVDHGLLFDLKSIFAKELTDYRL